MDTKLIGRQKMRGEHGFDCRLLEHRRQSITTLRDVDVEVSPGALL
ncbi:hypothetical protein [Mesorhizobium sp. SEMIA 3007]|nr:hypothetical protein [Mesorhizobium sp. SEMIA 3007]